MHGDQGLIKGGSPMTRLNASMNQRLQFQTILKIAGRQQGADKLDRNTMAKLAAFLTYCAAC